MAALAGIVPAVSDTTSSVLPEKAQDAVTPDIPVPVIEDTPGAVAVSTPREMACGNPAVARAEDGGCSRRRCAPRLSRMGVGDGDPRRRR